MPTELIINPYWKRFLIVRYPKEREREKRESSRWFAQYSSTRLLASSRYKFVESGGRGPRVCEYLQFFSRLLVRLAIALRDGGGGEGECLQCEPSVHFSNDLPSFGFDPWLDLSSSWRRKHELQRFVTRRLAIVAVACRLRMHNWIVRQIRFVTSNVARFGVCLRL